MLADALVGEGSAFLLVFARVGAALMLLPGFGELYVPARLRLLLALTISLALTATLAPLLPPLPKEALALGLLVGGEVAVGLFLGAAARLCLAALHVAGMAIAYQAGLSAAQMFDPNQSSQSTVTGQFLVLLALVLLFATDAHHLMLRGLVASYDSFPPGRPLPLGDMADAAARLAGGAFAVGVQIASPVLVAGLLFYLGLGALARLMPALQVFFIAIPLQILLGFALTLFSLAAGMLWFLHFYDGALALVFGGR